MSVKSETMYRMDAMRAAGLTPDLTLCVDTLTLQGTAMVTIPNPRWLALYNDSISVRLAYDKDKYGEAPQAEPTITPPPKPKALKPVPMTPIEGTFKDITEVPKHKMERTLLIATARGHAATMGTKDAHFAWLLNELADALEAAVDPDDVTNLED
jgi:hypothetical protein